MLQRLVASCCQLAINKRVPTSSASYAERLTAAISGYAWRDNLKNSRRGETRGSISTCCSLVSHRLYISQMDKRPVLKKHERASEIHRKNLTIFSISAQRVSVEEGLELRKRRLVRNVGGVYIYNGRKGTRVPGQPVRS